MQTKSPDATPRDAPLKGAALLVAAAALGACGGGDRQQADDRTLREAPAAVPERSITYAASNENFPNPERGLSVMMGHTGVSSLVPPFSWYAEYFRQRREQFGSSTLGIAYYLGPWKYGALPASFLQRMQQDFAAARRAGYKVYPHFHYAYSFTWPRSGAEGEKDASADTIVNHLRQLKPVLAGNADILLFLWPGMVGTYGEWWGSTSGNIGDGGVVNANTRRIIGAMLDATPPDRMMVTRYRSTKTSLLGGMGTLNDSTAWRNTARARIGFENQCFMGDDNSGTGTYRSGGTSGPWSYMNMEGRYVPLVGIPDPQCGDRSSTLAQMKAELNASNWDLLGSPPHGILGLAETDARVLDIVKHTGYRYRLLSAQVPASATAGGELALRIALTNDGSGSIFNPRAINLVLRNQSSGNVIALPTPDDGRGNRSVFPHPGQSRTWNLKLRLDANMPPGTYEVLLHLADPQPSLRQRAEYSIRLANRDLWEPATGYNKLNAVLAVR
jgi:Domain of unknown function (DUF4832)/Domain of unknown function (DUF4874)